jgi:hypothetical protein
MPPSTLTSKIATPFGVVDGRKFPDLVDAEIVDQNVDGRKQHADCVGSLFGGRVCGNPRHLAGRRLADAADDGIELSRVPAGNRDMCAFTRQRSGDLKADAGRGAGNERRPAFQMQIHGFVFLPVFHAGLMLVDQPSGVGRTVLAQSCSAKVRAVDNTGPQ